MIERQLDRSATPSMSFTRAARCSVAKGADLIAKHIRELAKEQPDLYGAVGQVIAFVYKLKNKTIA